MVGVRPTLASDADRVGNRVDDFELLWPPGETVNAYTDVGAGDGSIGRAIAGVVDAGTVHLFDVEASPDVTVVKQEEPLPLPDDSQDLVTALVTAHHVLDIDAWLDDVARVVKPSGYVYVREHDVSTMQDAHYINWVHLIDIARRRARRELASFHAEYYSSDDLEDTLSSLGIELVGRRVLSPPNPQRLYNALFQKTGDAASPTPLEGVSVSLGQSVKAYNHSPELRNKVQKLARRKLGARVNPAVRFESPTRAYDYLVS